MLTAKNICVITPTKDRCELLRQMLGSLLAQTQQVGQIIIADGGRNANHVVQSFENDLPIFWLDCPEVGQIPQRNLALKQVQENIKTIIYLDDDIVLESKSLEILIKFWNAQDREPAGVSFNLFGIRRQTESLYRKIFSMQLSPMGRVLKSGYNTPITEVGEDIKSDWLLGGATAWRSDILLNRVHTGVATSWAICEDLIFSYPIGKKEDLYVCADAKVRDIDNPPPSSFKKMRFRGRNAILWRYYFVSEHDELSKSLFFWMTFGQTLPRLVLGVLGDQRQLGNGIGHVEGFLKCFKCFLFGTDPRTILEN